MSRPTPTELAAISRLFSSSVVRELAQRGRSRLVARLAAQLPFVSGMKRSARLGDLFEAAFSILRRAGHRDEYIYKAALTHNVLLGKHSLQTAAMLTEFRVGACKADVAILNGSGTVYEIKSERDSLARLVKQLAAYRSVFARVNVIASEDHIRSVLDVVPSDVGVLILSKRNFISTLREAEDAPERTSPLAIFESIRASEAKAILTHFKIGVPSGPNTELRRAMRAQFARLDPAATHAAMVKVLRKTRNLSPLAGLVDELPPSLVPAALTTPLRKADHARLTASTNIRVSDALAWA
jgi:hypothetical protein